MDNKNILIKFRTQLFGIAAIGVIAVHSNSIINYPNIIKKIFGYGGLGVYIFAFLSGIGLYFSLKNRGDSKADFYKRRLVRIFLPYLLIAGLWYGVKYLFIQQDIISFLYELSTVSFWAEHKGAWYVAMLIPLYLIYPWYHDWLEKGNRNIKIVIIGISWLVLTVMISFFNPALYEHLSQVLSSILIFIVGNYIAEKIYNKKYNPIWLFIFSLVFFIGKTLLTTIVNNVVISSLAAAFLGVALTIGLAWTLDKTNVIFVNKTLGFLGKYSLELYLTNIFLLQAYKYFHLDTIFANMKYGPEIAYLIIVTVGIFSSWIFGALAAKIANSKFVDRKPNISEIKD